MRKPCLLAVGINSRLEELLDAGETSVKAAENAMLEAGRLADTTAALAARFTEEQLATLLCLGQSWVWETDKEHRFSFISKAMETATGLSVEDAIGKTRRECYFSVAGLTPAMLAHLDDLEHKRPFVDFVFRSSGKTKNKLWVSISGTPRFDDQGAFLGYIGVSRGLSDEAFVKSGLKNAADQLTRVEMLMADIIGSVPDGLAIWDKSGALLACNQNFRDMVGIGVDFETGENYETIIQRVLAANQVLNAEGSKEKWLADDLRTMREEAAIESLYQLPDGRWILRRVKRSPNGERVDIRTDVTEIKNTEHAAKLALEEAMLAQSVINGISEPIFVKDANLRFVFCNDAFAKMLGRNATEFPTRKASDFVGESEAAAYEDSELEVLIKGGTYEIEEDHFEDGKQKTRIVRKSRITTASGKNYIAGYMFDITALRLRERAMADASRRAESADKAKSDFLAQMSHEVRTPMNGVLSMTELLGQSALDERQKVFVDIIRKSGESLLATINAILDFTQIESGSLALEHVAFPLRTVVEDVAEILIAKALEKEIDVILNIAPDLPASIIGDEGRFRQIISNLLSNAIKFTENGQIIVTVTGTQNQYKKLQLSLSVADDGIGIPVDRLNQIFDRFSQINSTENAKPQGTGLGLSIVAKLANMMGGNCRVESTLGKGSTFTVELPMDCADLRAPSTPVSDALRAKRILIVDANPKWRNSLAVPLKYWGFDVAAVEDHHTAIAIANTLHIQGKIVDLMIIGCDEPNMTCVEIAAQIDHFWPTKPAVKLLIAPLTGKVAESTQLALNVHTMMTLPVKQASLYHHVISALQADAKVIEPVANPVSKPAPYASHIDVLIAEDNPVNQLVMMQIMAGSGLSYQIVANGELAVEAFSEVQPGLILMDIGMPKLNGFEATKAIRAMKELGGDQVPIIAVTAGSLGEDRDTCLKSGMTDHIAKPLSPDALIRKIQEWMPKQLQITA